MAEILIHNMRNPDQIVSASLTLRQAVMADGFDMISEGHVMWILQLSTTELGADGNLIPPIRKWLSTQETLSSDINDMVNELGTLIQWDSPVDTEAPVVTSCWPMDGASQVSVATSITVNIVDNVPSAGINVDSLRIKVKGFDLTNQMQVSSDINSCKVVVIPGTKHRSAI